MAAKIIYKQLYQVWKYKGLCDIYTYTSMYILHNMSQKIK
jgi:hypothetical protein